MRVLKVVCPKCGPTRAVEVRASVTLRRYIKGMDLEGFPERGSEMMYESGAQAYYECYQCHETLAASWAELVDHFAVEASRTELEEAAAKILRNRCWECDGCRGIMAAYGRTVLTMALRRDDSERTRRMRAAVLANPCRWWADVEIDVIEEALKG